MFLFLGHTKYSTLDPLFAFPLLNAFVLELEDVVKGSEQTTDVFAAITELLAEETSRTWRYIKFIDGVHVTHNDQKEVAGMLLDHYSEKRQQLCDQVAPYAANKPIIFQLKVEVAENTSLESLLVLLRHLKGMGFAKSEFGGALFGVRRENIAEKLARLCSKSYQSSLLGSSSRYEEEEEDGSEDEAPYLHEMVMFSLSYAGVDTATGNSNATTQILDDCIDQLEKVTRQSASIIEDISSKSTTSSIDASNGRRAGRRRSPKRKSKNLRENREARSKTPEQVLQMKRALAKLESMQSIAPPAAKKEMEPKMPTVTHTKKRKLVPTGRLTGRKSTLWQGAERAHRMSQSTENSSDSEDGDDTKNHVHSVPKVKSYRQI